jgi:hypothetical protein
MLLRTALAAVLFAAALAGAFAAGHYTAVAAAPPCGPPGPHRFGAAGPSNAMPIQIGDNTGAYVASVVDAGGGVAALVVVP